MRTKISDEYIRGLVEGDGSFTFSTTTSKRADGSVVKSKVPAFMISMHVRDYDLLCKVRDSMGLDSKVYIYGPYESKDNYNRGKKAVLTVREIGNLKNVVVPFFYNKLVGNRGIQFNDWLGTIGIDPSISEGYKIIYRLHKNGYYAKNAKIAQKV